MVHKVASLEVTSMEKDERIVKFLSILSISSEMAENADAGIDGPDYRQAWSIM